MPSRRPAARLAHLALRAAAWSILAAWLLGLALSDRFTWSQFLAWIPSPIALAAAAALVALAVPLAPRRDRAPHRARFLLPAALLTALLYMLLVQWRYPTFPITHAPAHLRVIHWNASMNIREGWHSTILDHHPDLLLINPASYQPWDDIRAAFDGHTILHFHGFAVFSRLPVARYAYLPLGITPGAGLDLREPDALRRHVDTGRALILELDTAGSPLGAPLVVWWLDLPSDISLHRRRVTAQASETLARFTGPWFVRHPDGSYARVSHSSHAPPPDLVIGDLNIPRGSFSLASLTQGLTNAHTLAGAGPAFSYPRELPLWHLDQAFVHPRLAVTDYRVFDPGQGTHRAQSLDLRAAAPTR
ncbi:MAG: endonuclease/exonuclease/phosphatase family protein [Phycisphaeraceae bacterium]|nr:MAG: endonuclease/exonuclease/phosphatase family protein [Phycisphaeraceae bacterium]